MDKTKMLLEAIKEDPSNKMETPKGEEAKAGETVKKPRSRRPKESPEDEITRTNITLPLGLHAKAKAHCIRCRISFSAYLVSLMEKDLKGE